MSLEMEVAGSAKQQNTRHFLVSRTFLWHYSGFVKVATTTKAQNESNTGSKSTTNQPACLGAQRRGRTGTALISEGVGGTSVTS